MQGKCILVGAGELKNPDIKKEKEDYIIAVDGGMYYCEQLGLEPDFYIGDFDSVEDRQLSRLKVIEQAKPECVRRLKPEKDDTDMISALRHGLERGYKEFHIYAGLGGRLEHTIANIQSLIFLKERGAGGYLLDEHMSCFVIRNESVSLFAGKRGYLSLFAMGERAEGVSICGMKYPLDGATITNGFPIGIDNEFVGERAQIRVESGTLLVLIREYI